MIIVIAGPTGVGKTELSLELAKHYDCEIISGDSMQVYRGMDIGTAKVSPFEKAQVPHHLIDTVEVEEEYSVANYQTDARRAIKNIKAKGKTPMIVGGSGFYIKAALHDFTFDDTKRDPGFAKGFKNWDNHTLYEHLKEYDARSAASIHPNNRLRVLQALQRAYEGNRKSAHQTGHTPLYDYVLIVLSMPRKTLYERIESRVEQMMDQGLLEEARMLYQMPLSKTAREAISYKELFKHFQGEWCLDESVEQIKTNTRRLAKRQFTYFYNQFEFNEIDVSNQDLSARIKQAKKVIDHSNQ